MREIKKNEGSDEKISAYVLYEAGKTCFVSSILELIEVSDRVRLTRVAHAPEELLGLVNLRGEVISVFSLERLLNLPQSDLKDSRARLFFVECEGETLGFYIPRLVGMYNLRDSRFQSAPENLSSFLSLCVESCVNVQGKNFLLLSLRRLCERHPSFREKEE